MPFVSAFDRYILNRFFDGPYTKLGILFLYSAEGDVVQTLRRCGFERDTKTRSQTPSGMFKDPQRSADPGLETTAPERNTRGVNGE